MIVAVALNPAWDRTYYLSDLCPGRVHRVDEVHVVPGGKAVNVARVLRALRAEVTVTGFIGGGSASDFVGQLESRGIAVEFVPSVAAIRHTVTLVERGTGRVTELREPGGAIRPVEASALEAKFSGLLERAKLVVVSGSLPSGGCPPALYRRLIQAAQRHGVRVFVDTAGAPLREALRGDPYLVRLNLDEAREFWGMTAGNDEEPLGVAQAAARRFGAWGVQVAVVSVGKLGACMAWENKVFHARLALKRALNPVGSGDAMMAAMAYACVQGLTPLDWLRLGVAAGAANALALTAGSCGRDEVWDMAGRIQ